MQIKFRLFNKIYILLILITLFSCKSAEEYNLKLEQPIPVEKLQKDIDYVQHKLEKLHPSLYKYISKEALNAKFDSIRNVINKPITSKEFYFLISPVVASVRQGHMQLSPPFKLVSKKEQKRLKAAGIGPLSQFDFEWMNDKLYVLRNRSKQTSIKSGAEVISVNKMQPQEIHNKYRKTYTSDGLNTTYLPRAFSKRFSTYLTNEIGINDSITYVFKQNDSLKTIVVSRLKPEKKVKTAVDIVPKSDIKKIVITKKEKRIYGFDETTKSFSKSLSFVAIDSSVAILKIKDFSKGKYKKAYTTIFEKLKNNNAKTLVIDLRNNPGGRVVEVVKLFSYLTNSDYTMLQTAQVVSKTSLWKLGLFNKLPVIGYPFAAVFYPFYMGFSTLRTKKQDDGTFTYRLEGARKLKNNPNHFTGKIYVITNGSSFSAACLLSASLKANPNVTFVGEETGGGFNSTVAGLLPILSLPNSKLPLRIGLMDIKTTNQTPVFGHGIYPDKEIIPTLQDKIENKDPELDWILSDVKLKK
ncbi:S41 family peptidase [Flavobacterium sp. SUN052]|uniref:S41 family peptidase n=1 Tax=Flavobacterium sp. SUN052 TaxID=3002441 RepID=UPI00237EAF39|nr:S41 family peptidase [Flavobacterium sp. SUN052]MEC4003699.1 S41 family peptidase [Flavobacterium sp. SUN052]